MTTRIPTLIASGLPLAALICVAASAQVPVDDDGNLIGTYATGDAEALEDAAAIGNEGIPLLNAAELEELVGPVALYPDDLLAIVLPASTYPLQVVQAARFLAELEDDPSLKPDPDWDDSVIALVNYPEVVELLNDDLDWTWRLGEAVVAQQADVVNAVESFRDRAYAAGNLKSDEYQTVEYDEGIIEIIPVNEDVIYVPYYEPERVVYRQPRPVYYYYPRPCPVYYYPYPAGYAFSRPYFWGVTTAFRIGWTSNHLRVFHPSYHGHPYFGRHYYDRWWYRRPDIHVYNNVYTRNNVNVTVNRYVDGDYWRPGRQMRLRASDQRVTRNTHHRDQRSTTVHRRADVRRGSDRRVETLRSGTQARADRTRLTSPERMRRTITDVQRERRSQTGAVPERQVARRPAEQRAARDRQSARAQSSRRYPTARQDGEPGTVERRTIRPQTTQRQLTQRQTTQRTTTERQSVRARQPAERRAVQRQTTARATTERRSAPRQAAQRRTTERQPVVQSQRAERRAAEPTASRRTAPRQAGTRPTSESSGSARTESSKRSRSERNQHRRR